MVETKTWKIRGISGEMWKMKQAHLVKSPLK